MSESRATRLLAPSLLALLCSAGCSETHSNPLFLGIQLVTDLAPRREFASIEVELADGTVRRTEAVHDSYLTPQRVADFDNLGPSAHRRLTVRLLDEKGVEVLAREVELAQSRSMTRNVTLTRSCASVSCKGIEASCFGGKCVDPSCLDGSEAACPDGLCARDRDCSVQSECETATCRFGACLVGSARCDAGADVDAGGDDLLRCDGGVCRLDAACASFSYSTHRYWLCELLLGYQAAKAFCAADGAHLVTIQSEGESVAIGQRITLVKGPTLPGSHHFIGLDDLGTPGTFGWIDGTKLSYKNWRSGEPNNRMTMYCEREACGTILASGQWADSCCALKLPFVCEAELP